MHSAKILIELGWQRAVSNTADLSWVRSFGDWSKMFSDLVLIDSTPNLPQEIRKTTQTTQILDWEVSAKSWASKTRILATPSATGCRTVNLISLQVRKKWIHTRWTITGGLHKFIVSSDPSPGTCKADCETRDATYFFLGSSSNVFRRNVYEKAVVWLRFDFIGCLQELGFLCWKHL